MKEEIKFFLNCDLDEANYYSLLRENLVTLREYLLQLKGKDNDFKFAIQEQFQSIKKKCNWLTAIYLYSKDGIDLIASYNNINNRYEDLTKNVSKIYLLSGKLKNIY